MVDRGWSVIRVDFQETFRPDIVADIRKLNLRNYRPDLIWGSPPCTEFSRVALPWIKDAVEPDMSLVEAFHNIVDELKPRWWILENVQGAVRYFGTPQFKSGPVKLWGRFPPIHCKVKPWKERLSSSQKEKRAKMPNNLSVAVAIACESTLPYR